MDFSEFTEAGFHRILIALKEEGYTFAPFGSIDQDRHVLFRHDVDYSIHRAAALAAIEAAEGVRSTYFLLPRGKYYNIFEKDCAEAVHKIIRAGHWIGLHFDAEYFGVTDWSAEQLDIAVRKEICLIENVVDKPVNSVSYHNPDQSNLLEFDADKIAGLHNAYSRRLRTEYVYASDSNGYWRFRPMLDVIADRAERLHLTTHPEWWTPEPMSPYQRLERCVSGRAGSGRRYYDQLLDRSGRENIGR